ncbi:MAG: class I SAM-dependent DNA methyltransferase [Saprospirales bacterium]|nr:MAG: class I SAM-dependent DNA methyltransferase [Saprospirales bacterium]
MENLLKPRQALNKAFLKVKPTRAEIERFKQQLTLVLDRTNDTESEEFHKNLISDFLKNTWYAPDHFINTKGRKDLVIHNGKNSSSSVGVILEVKKPTNRHEMISRTELNTKALQELLLYYLRERITNKNLELRHLVVTNIREWFLFDAQHLERLFVRDKQLLKQFTDFEAGRLSGTTTDFFYREIAAPFIEKIKAELSYAFFDIRNYEKALLNDNPADDRKLIALYKLLSPEHLLKKPFANDSNSLNKDFYLEFLHIIGLKQTGGSKKLIERLAPSERDSGSLLENAIEQLDLTDRLRRVPNASRFGQKREEALFNLALELVITWTNRILFLKLLEAQLLNYHRGDESYSFLRYDRIRNFDELNSLFFAVLAKHPDERSAGIREEYAKVPYLNSSLFEFTELEYSSLFVNHLRDDRAMQLHPKTVLKNYDGKRRSGSINALEYLFEFLNHYDFSSEGGEDIQEDNKTLINASVLGLIFEKINGYKDGSFFTPGFITMYMCRETIRRSVLQKFKEEKGWECKDMDELYDRIEDRTEANSIVNSLKICDPAVGSGHFLVSALNEMIAVKNDLKILQDRQGRRLKEYYFEVVNDELVVTDEDGALFEYRPGNRESQRVQETLFHEKQQIIENCLFGVDINPNSVKICRLRLWIELLKNAYYTPSSPPMLETLPNVDINIKCGNSLISRFDLDTDLSAALRKSRYSVEAYRAAVASYHHARSRDEKQELMQLIDGIKGDFRSEINTSDPLYKKANKLEGEIFNLANASLLFEESEKEKEGRRKKEEKLSVQLEKIRSQMEEIANNKIYDNAFEWRFEFPEVLKDDGSFRGFDVVIGNPPYIKEYEGKEMFDGLRELEIYQGKMDMWYLFGALGIQILRKKGLLSFIAPNNWVTNAGASKFRDYMLLNSKFIELVDFSSYMIFESASIQTMVMFFEKNSKADNYYFTFKQIKSKNPDVNDVLGLLQKKQSPSVEIFEALISKVNLKGENHTFNKPTIEKVLKKIFKSEQQFKLTNDEVAQGIVIPQDYINKRSKEKLGESFDIGQGIFVFNQDELIKLELSLVENKLVKPYFTTSNFNRYWSDKKNKEWIIYTDSSFKNPDSMETYPALKQHLDRFKDVITSDNKPYGLHRARDERFFIGEKIVVQRKCPKRPVFTHVEFNSYISATFYLIKTDKVDLKYLTGLLNSKLIEFWLRYRGKMQGNNFQIDKAPLVNIPVFKADEDIQNKIKTLVSEIISIKRQDPSADTTSLEMEIDRLVYELYGLGEEEVGVVENV